VTVLLAPAQWAAFRAEAPWSTLPRWEARTMQYDPPWYQDRSKIAHLLAPLPAHEVMVPHASISGGGGGGGGGLTDGSTQLCVCVCGSLLDPALGTHTAGTFDRVWDRGGLSAAIADGGGEGGARYVAALAALVVPGGRVLAFANEGPAPQHPGMGITELRDWCEQACAGASKPKLEAHVAHTVPKALQGGGMQRRAAFSICVCDTAGQVTYRPPSCPCCQ
jgi:hypothetical protein